MNLYEEAYKKQTGGAASEKTKILAQIAEYEKKLSVARDLLVAEKIDVADYNMMKIANSTILKSLERQLAEGAGVKEDVEHIVNQGVDNLLKLGNNFKNSTLVEARDMIGLIFPENFTFRESHFQTTRVNEIVRCIYLVSK